MADDRIVLTRSLGTHLGGFVLMAALAAAGGFGAFSTGDGKLWLIFGIFAAMSLTFAVQLLPGSGKLEIGPEGLAVTTLFFTHRYLWSDIDGFRAGKVYGKPVVMIDLSASFRERMRSRTTARRMAGAEAMLPDTYGKAADELATLLNERRAMHAPHR